MVTRPPLLLLLSTKALGAEHGFGHDDSGAAPFSWWLFVGWHHCLSTGGLGWSRASL